MATYAIKCSSFSKMNRGTSRRAECCAIGWTAYPSVQVANTLLERPDGFKVFSMAGYFMGSGDPNKARPLLHSSMCIYS